MHSRPEKKCCCENGCLLCVQLCDWKTLFNSCGFTRCCTRSTFLVSFRKTSLDFHSLVFMAMVLDFIRWLSEVLFRWTLISCQLSEMVFPKYGWVYRLRSAVESRCLRWGSGGLCGRRKGAEVEEEACMSHTALSTAEWFSRIGQLLFLFTKWTWKSVSKQTVSFR